VQVNNVYKGVGMKEGLVQILVEGGFAQSESNIKEMVEVPFYLEDAVHTPKFNAIGQKGIIAGKMTSIDKGIKWNKTIENNIVIENTLRIGKKVGKQVPDIEKLSLDDEAAYKVLQDAHTTGVFQLESTGMKRYLKQLKPTVFEDIIAMVALYRPGPMEYIPDFIAGKHGTREVKYLHPKLEPILKNTYGVAVYQEQLMQIARDLAGFTLGEADVLRKAVGKKIKELVDGQRVKFVEGCEKTGVGRAIGEKVFAFIEPFAGYGFNRSHAACYALIGYQTAYLKAHFPAEFMAALLTSDQGDTDRIAIEVREAREIGIDVLPPDINESFDTFAVIKGDNDKEHIRFGLNAVKNVGVQAAEEIVAERKRHGKYTSLEDFMERVQTKDLNKRTIEALAKVGAFDGLSERKTVLDNLDAILTHGKELRALKETHSQSLFNDMPLPEMRIPLRETAHSTKQERLAWEKELLGLYVTDHPMTEYTDYLKKTAVEIGQLEKIADGKHVTIGGVITSARKSLSKSGQPLYFVTLEDMSGRVDVLVFGKTAERVAGLLNEDTIILVDLKIARKDGLLRLAADDVRPMSMTTIAHFERVSRTHEKYHSDQAPLPSKPSPCIIIHCADTANSRLFDEIGKTLRHLPPGPVGINLRLLGQTIKTSFSIVSDPATMQMLSTLSGVERVEETIA
jgi:DNA polymerase-3 subunit alpha